MLKARETENIRLIIFLTMHLSCKSISRKSLFDPPCMLGKKMVFIPVASLNYQCLLSAEREEMACNCGPEMGRISSRVHERAERLHYLFIKLAFFFFFFFWCSCFALFLLLYFVRQMCHKCTTPASFIHAFMLLPIDDSFQ